MRTSTKWVSVFQHVADNNGHGHLPLKVPNIDFFSILGYWCICICWQHAALNTYIENQTSHLHAMLRTHIINFEVRFLLISAHTSKTRAACCQQIQIHQIWCLVLSMISVPDNNNWPGKNCSDYFGREWNEHSAFLQHSKTFIFALNRKTQYSYQEICNVVAGTMEDSVTGPHNGRHEHCPRPSASKVIEITDPDNLVSMGKVGF